MGLASVSSYQIIQGATFKNDQRSDGVQLVLWLKEGHPDPSIRSIHLVFDEAEMKTYGLGYVARESVVAFFPPSAFADYCRAVQQEQSIHAGWSSSESGLDTFSLFARRDLAGDVKADLMAEDEVGLQVPPPRP